MRTKHEIQYCGASVCASTAEWFNVGMLTNPMGTGPQIPPLSEVGYNCVVDGTLYSTVDDCISAAPGTSVVNATVTNCANTFGGMTNYLSNTDDPFQQGHVLMVHLKGCADSNMDQNVYTVNYPLHLTNGELLECDNPGAAGDPNTCKIQAGSNFPLPVPDPSSGPMVTITSSGCTSAMFSGKYDVGVAYGNLSGYTALSSAGVTTTMSLTSGECINVLASSVANASFCAVYAVVVSVGVVFSTTNGGANSGNATIEIGPKVRGLTVDANGVQEAIAMNSGQESSGVFDSNVINAGDTTSTPAGAASIEVLGYQNYTGSQSSRMMDVTVSPSKCSTTHPCFGGHPIQTVMTATVSTATVLCTSSLPSDFVAGATVWLLNVGGGWNGFHTIATIVSGSSFTVSSPGTSNESGGTAEIVVTTAVWTQNCVKFAHTGFLHAFEDIDCAQGDIMGASSTPANYVSFEFLGPTEAGSGGGLGNPTVSLTGFHNEALGSNQFPCVENEGYNLVLTDGTCNAPVPSGSAAVILDSGQTTILALTPVASPIKDNINGVTPYGAGARVSFYTNNGVPGHAFSPDLTALNSANIYVGNASNLPVGVPVTGDVSLTNTGATTVKAIQSSPVASTTPSVGNVLVWSASAGEWVVASLSDGVQFTDNGASGSYLGQNPEDTGDVFMRDEFCSVGSTNGALGQLNWLNSAVNSGSGSVSFPTPSFPNPCLMQNSSGTAGANTGELLNLNEFGDWAGITNWSITFVFALVTDMHQRFHIGLMDRTNTGPPGSSPGFTQSIDLRFDPGASSTPDTYWTVEACASTSCTTSTALGPAGGNVTPDTNFHKLHVYSPTTAGEVWWTLDGNATVCMTTALTGGCSGAGTTIHSAHVPFSTTVAPATYEVTSTTSAVQVNLDFFGLRIHGLSR